MRRRTGIAALWAMGVSLFALLACGCADRTQETEDPVIEGLKRIRPETQADTERINLAISLWQNDVMDPQPMLLYAAIGQWGGVEVAGAAFALQFGLYDEDKDVVGFVVREEHIGPDGSRETLTEEYPVFIHYPMGGIYRPRLFPARVRTSGQRKDEKEWQTYVAPQTLDEAPYRGVESWWKTLPAVYVSIPEPNRTNVQVYLYDQAGHESNPVDLLHCPPRKRP